MNNKIIMSGYDMFKLMEELFPINRSLTGEGVRKTLDILSRFVKLNRHYELTGAKHFDWVVPKEWRVISARLLNLNGDVLVDYSNSNLHLLGYSISKNSIVSRDELCDHLFYLEDLPKAIPYVTSYYNPNWGFCVTFDQFKQLNDEYYKVEINTEHFDGKLDYADYIIKGTSNEEIVFSTYICHPSMASNELSGPVALIGLIKYLENIPARKYTYRFIFVPETIGSIIYINKYYHHLKQKTIAGFIVTCVGDDGDFSFVETPFGDKLVDKIVRAVLINYGNFAKIYKFLERGSDERQYCFPNVNLPFVAITRTKYYEYPEYHTSLDNLDYCTPKALGNSLDYLVDIVNLIEKNETYVATSTCEPQLGKRGLYPLLSTKSSNDIVKNMMNVLTYCDGKTDIVSIIDILKVPSSEVLEIIDLLYKKELIRLV
jgi:aminopeptidase-like protein